MNHSLPLFDITARKHRGSPESVAANTRVDKKAGRSAVIKVLSAHRATAKEIAEELGVGINVISGRCSELKMLKVARATGTRRNGSMELELIR